MSDPVIVSISDDELARDLVRFVPLIGRTPVTDAMRHEAAVRIAKSIIRGTPKDSHISLIEVDAGSSRFQMRHADLSPWTVHDIAEFVEERLKLLLDEGGLEESMRAVRARSVM